MKSIGTILLFTVLVVGTVNGQTQNTLSSVQFADQSTVFSVTYLGEVLRSSDAGQSWSILAQPTTQSLLGISMGSLITGVAVGGTNIQFSNGTGVLMTTQDGGSTWASQSSPNGRVLRGVKMINSSVGFIVGGNNGSVDIGNGTILRTSDGGQSWQAQTSGTTQALYAVDFVDQNNGVAVGGLGTILRTDNGGQTWTSEATSTGILYGVSYGSASAVTAVGRSGVVLRSQDGGRTWASQSSGVAYDLYGVDFADANLGVAVGYSGAIVRTTNGGSTWTRITSPAGSTTLYSVMFRDASVGIIVGNGGTILLTSNGGLTWQSPSGGGSTNPPAAPTLSSPGNGATGQPTTLTLSWNASSGASTYRLQVSTSSSFGSTVYDNASLTGTSQSVGPLASNTTYYWHVSASNGAGTSAYSSTWSFTTNGGGPLFSVAPTSINFGTVPTKSTKIDSVTVSNGGTSTLSISSIVSSSSSFGVSPTSATVAPGASQKIYISFTPKNKNRVNGTITFTHNAPGSPNSVSVSGSGGSTPKGRGPNKPSIAELDEVILDQNYPNPFNPSTVIAYYLPEESIVNLTVYNIIGQEVTTLVNQVVDAGYHSTIWSAANINGVPLPSGIYIYRLHATTLPSGEVFTEFRKMYLLK